MEAYDVDKMLSYHKDLVGAFWDVFINNSKDGEFYYKNYFDEKLPKYFRILTYILEN
jgi:hypothetical protein